MKELASVKTIFWGTREILGDKKCFKSLEMP
jgi:hypothetical protein